MDTQQIEQPPPELSPRAAYCRFLEQGVLAFQVDADGRAVFHPRARAPLGHRDPLRWRASAGRGAVYATTTLHERAGTTRNLALVDLDEGFRMMSRVEGLPPEAVPVGLRVRLVFAQPVSEGEPPLPVFEPDPAAVG